MPVTSQKTSPDFKHGLTTLPSTPVLTPAGAPRGARLRLSHVCKIWAQQQRFVHALDWLLLTCMSHSFCSSLLHLLSVRSEPL